MDGVTVGVIDGVTETVIEGVTVGVGVGVTLGHITDDPNTPAVTGYMVLDIEIYPVNNVAHPVDK
jgi:hypothetical protein